MNILIFTQYLCYQNSRIRTCDLRIPNATPYQTGLYSESNVIVGLSPTPWGLNPYAKLLAHPAYREVSNEMTFYTLHLFLSYVQTFNLSFPKM